MKKFAKVIFIIKYLLLVLLLSSSAFGRSNFLNTGEWERMTHFPFTLYFQETDSKNAENILNTLNENYPILSQQLGIELQDTVFIFISPTKKSFRQFVGKTFPEWSDGVASPSRNSIILKSPRLQPDYPDNSKIVIHELTHILVDKITKGTPIPRWLNEGLSVYYSGEKGFASSSLVSKALISKSVIPLSDIDRVLRFHLEKAQLAYQESYLAVRYLFNEYGEAEVREILNLVGNGLNLNDAFIRVIDTDLWEFETEWLEHIKKKYRWQFLMDFDTYLWILMGLLFLLGFALMRMRNRRKIQQWEEEEEDENPEYW